MRRHVLAAVAILLVACGGDKTTGPNNTVTGNYTLRTVNGATLPAMFYQDQVERDEFFAGNIVLADDHSWTGSLSVKATAIPSGALLFNGPLPISGTYALNANSITITDGAHGLSFTGTVTGGTMSVAIDLGDIQTTALVFSK